MMSRDGWNVCERCHGDGGPPSWFDDERGRWEHYVCSSCGGAGGRRDPRPDDLEAVTS